MAGTPACTRDHGSAAIAGARPRPTGSRRVRPPIAHISCAAAAESDVALAAYRVLEAAVSSAENSDSDFSSAVNERCSCAKDIAGILNRMHPMGR
jgi:hypothetical protein